MANKITGYQTFDGYFYDNHEDANFHEKKEELRQVLDDHLTFSTDLLEPLTVLIKDNYLLFSGIGALARTIEERKLKEDGPSKEPSKIKTQDKKTSSK